MEALSVSAFLASSCTICMLLCACISRTDTLKIFDLEGANGHSLWSSLRGGWSKNGQLANGVLLDHVKTMNFLSRFEKRLFFYGWDLNDLLDVITNHLIDKGNKKCGLISIRDKPLC